MDIKNKKGIENRQRKKNVKSTEMLIYYGSAASHRAGVSIFNVIVFTKKLNKTKTPQTACFLVSTRDILFVHFFSCLG